MSNFEEYFAQGSSDASSHYAVHTDKWIDEGSVSIYGHSGHCDEHTDEKN